MSVYIINLPLIGALCDIPFWKLNFDTLEINYKTRMFFMIYSSCIF